ncbi:MAG: hypothetical protein DRN04_04005 [Thermoprotei archaeon]|nr:MAG: hypothetical protein DRN04_04005 [Thermoprotei archaeon]
MVINSKKAFTLIFIIVLSVVIATVPEATVSHRETINWEDLEAFLKNFNYSKVLKHIEYFGSLDSRLTGYPGAWEALRYIYSELELYGYDLVYFQNFTTVVPVVREAYIEVKSGETVSKFKVYPVWPNLVQTSPTGPEGISGKLLYLGKGDLESIKGIDIKDAIVLLDYNSGDNWVKLAELGARAVIFIEPLSTNRFESFNKFVYVNLYFPRVYVDRKTGIELKKLCEKDAATARLILDYSMEEVVSANVVAFLKGKGSTNDSLVLAAYIDDWSPVPELASHYDSACGAAVLLEVARLLAKSKPELNVIVVFFTGHWEGLCGPRAFVEEVLEVFADRTLQNHPIWNQSVPKTFLSLDLSTGSSSVALLHSGGFYHVAGPSIFEECVDMFRGMDFLLREYGRSNRLADLVKKYSGRAPEIYYQLIDQSGGAYVEAGELEYFTPVPYKYIADVEPWLQAGLPGYTLFTAFDYRFTWFTPLKERVHFNPDNLKPQAYYVAALSYIYSNVVTSDYPPRRVWGPTRYYFPGPFAPFVPGFTKMRGQVVVYLPISPRQYEPLMNETIVAIVDSEDQYNIFNYIFLKTKPNGTFVVHGLAIDRGGGARTYMARLYVIDYKNKGRILYTNDYGKYGAEAIYTTRTFSVREGVYGWPQPLRFVVFKCASITMFSVTFPQGMLDLYNYMSIYKTLQARDVSVIVREFTSHSEVYHYGYEVDPMSRILVVYVKPEERIEIEVHVRSQEGPIYLTILLLNASEKYPEGAGYYLNEPGESLVLLKSTLHYVENFYWLSRYRIDLAARFGVFDAESQRSLRMLEEWRNLTKEYLEEKDYSKAYYASLIAWAWAQKLYYSSRGLIQGSSTTTVVYFVMLIPFAFVLERLLFEFYEGRKRLLTIACIFAIFIVLMWLNHPGFHLVASMPTLLLGFVILTISVVIGFLLYTDFQGVMWRVRKKTLGVHFVEVSRWDVMVSSLYYGVVNMKRHKVTSLLTLTAIVIITMSLISLTSITTHTVLKTLSITAEPSYTGLLARYVSYDTLPESFVECLKVLSEEEVARRAWLYGPIEGSTLWGEIPVEYEGKKETVRAIVGLDEVDGKVLGIEAATIYRRWSELFREISPDVISCIINRKLAEFLGIKSVPAKVKIWGIDFIVVDIFDPAALGGVRDIDNEPIAPFNIWSTEAGASGIVVTERLQWDTIIIIPYSVLEKFPGSIRASTAVVGEDYTKLDKFARILAEMTYNMYLFVSDGKKVKGYVSLVGLAARGWSFLLPAIVIASLIMFNMMISLVQQRTNEVKTLSALGLAPLHVVGLFFSEAIAYALIGGVIGYTTGIFVLKALTPLMGPGFYPNYTSGAVVLAIALSFVTVIVPSIIPAFRMGALVTPSLERKWKITTKPRGDIWEIPTPFRATKVEAPGVLLYVKEFLDAHRTERAHRWFASLEEAKITSFEMEGKKGYALKTRVMLYPWEAGLKQEVEIAALPEDGISRFTVALRLESGPREVWIRSNKAFLDILRKQFLLWRSIVPSERREYVKKALDLVGLKEGE